MNSSISQHTRQIHSSSRLVVEFATAGRIVFGRGKLRELPAMARVFGADALVITGKNSRRAEPLLAQLGSEGVHASVLAVEAEPTVDFVRSGAQAARGCQMVIGFGGGSAIEQLRRSQPWRRTRASRLTIWK